MTRRMETPVLIVGGGPIGLTLALDLGWRGIECVLIEQGDGSIDLPRGAMVAARTMEFCRRWGIKDRIVHAGFPDDYKLDIVFCTSLAGHLLARDEYPCERDQRPPPESPEKRTWCPQLVFDPTIARSAAELDGVSLRYRCRFDGCTEHSDRIVAQATDLASGEAVEIEARYLVACDGSASAVRKAAGIELEGTPVLSYSVNVFFRCRDFLRGHDKGEAERYLFVGSEGTWGNATVVDGKEEWRLTVIGSNARVDMGAFDARAAVHRAMGRDDVPFELIAVRPWRRAEAIAKDYRAGRVLLAGDAAHVMSPTGGFGMNTGVIDSVNLGWKLEAMLRGWGGAHLLDSYYPEQKPIAKRNSDFSTRNFNAWVAAQGDCSLIFDESDAGAGARRAVGTRLKDTLTSEWQCLGVQLGYRYEGSPICIPDGSPATQDDVSHYVPTARPGSRAPHAWLPDGRSTLDLYGRGFVLLRFDAGDAHALEAAARAQHVPLAVHDIAAPAIAALYERKLVLVRPDGHVAWRGNEVSDASRIIATARGAEAPARQSATLAARGVHAEQ
jgi:2-polyprenyl-6-methoxyphenol hydroxylase-like FAD-dependent oxidoreductase